ncbi:MAG: DUF2029 domain-containing protein [Clostridia bacterium]|nr:DUF2029 domain-containing protein [Clostridia bacterium]
MKSKLHKLHVCSYLQLYIVIETLIIFLFTIHNYLLDGQFLNTLMIDPNSQFGDHFMHIGFASLPWGTNIYELSPQACFPPLAYLMYGFLARIIGYQAENPTDILSHRFIGNNLTIYIIFCLVCILLLAYALNLFIKKTGFTYQFWLPCIIAISYPVALSSIQRGNDVLLVAVLLCIAFAWKEDASKLKRELAMILIAICAGLKIYPAIAGLLYIKEKRYSEAIRLVLYGIILFFVPFIFFDGTNGLMTFVNTLIGLNGEIHRFSVSGLFNELSMKLTGTVFPRITLIVQQSFFVLSIVAFFLCKEKWEEILILCCIMAVYISSSWMYTCVYLLPAMLLFFQHTGDESIHINKANWGEGVAFLMFSLTFIIPYPFHFIRIYDVIIALDTFYILKIIVESIFKHFRKPKMIQ